MSAPAAKLRTRALDVQAHRLSRTRCISSSTTDRAIAGEVHKFCTTATAYIQHNLSDESRNGEICFTIEFSARMARLAAAFGSKASDDIFPSAMSTSRATVESTCLSSTSASNSSAPASRIKSPRASAVSPLQESSKLANCHAPAARVSAFSRDSRMKGRQNARPARKRCGTIRCGRATRHPGAAARLERAARGTGKTVSS
eukprot:6205312-Pleurochrysis_carterae.AAC.2